MAESNLVTSLVENVDTNKVKITITISPERFKEGLNDAYNRNKHYFNLPGFRKGKAPRKLIEQAYGKEVFFEDAINFVLPDAYEDSLDEHELDPVYRPDISTGDVSEKEGAVFYAEVYIRPIGEISDYGDLTYPKGNTEATDEEVEQELKKQQEKNARQISITRPAEIGDIAIINFEGFIDGEAFDGGSGEDFSLALGSGQFIPGFEEQLVGSTPGDDIKVNVTFPEEYHEPNFAGKDAVFEVEVLDIQGKEMPELDDEFAQDVSEHDTLDEYREELKERIEKAKADNLENNKRAHILKQLVAKTTVEIPDVMYDARIEEMMDEFKRNAQMQGLDVESYMRFTQLTPESLQASWKPQAVIDVKNLMTLEAIVRKENLILNDGEFAEKLGETMKLEGDALDKFVSSIADSRRKEIERSMLCEKALEIVMEKATAVEGDYEAELEIEPEEE